MYTNSVSLYSTVQTVFSSQTSVHLIPYKNFLEHNESRKSDVVLKGGITFTLNSIAETTVAVTKLQASASQQNRTTLLT